MVDRGATVAGVNPVRGLERMCVGVGRRNVRAVVSRMDIGLDSRLSLCQAARHLYTPLSHGGGPSTVDPDTI